MAYRLKLPFSMEKAVKRIMILSFLVFLLWLIPNIGRILFVIFLIGASILLGLYRRIVPFYLGIELITFTVVVTAYLVNPIIAWVAALIILSAQAIITGHITIHYFIKIGIYTIVVIFSSVASGMPISIAGKAMAIFVNISYLGANAALGDFQGMMDTPGNIINIFLNFWLFSQTAGILDALSV